jgi:hypothetical protein
VQAGASSSSDSSIWITNEISYGMILYLLFRRTCSCRSNNIIPVQEGASSPKMVFSSKDIERVPEPQIQGTLYSFQSWLLL